MLLPLHIAFMILGVLLITVAIVIARGRKQGWFQQHRLFAILGTLSVLIAFALIFTFKAVSGYPHLTSVHAWAGATAILLVILAPLTGFLASKGKNNLRGPHKVLGRIAGFFLYLAAILGAITFYRLSAGSK